MNSLKILVADDSVTIQKVIRLALSHEGYEIRGVSHEKELIEQNALFQPNVIIMDSTLSGKSAFDLKDNLDQDSQNKKTRYILMSNTFEVIDDQKLEQSNFHGKLTKPFDPSQLRESIQSLFSEQSTDSEEGSDIKPFHEETVSDQSEWAISDSAKKGLLNNFSDKEEEIHFENEDFTSSFSKVEPTTSMNDEIDFDLDLSLDKENTSLYENNLKSNQENVSELNESEVRNFLEEETRKMIQKIIPEIAEKILKEEINKLLDNPPSR